MLRISTSLSRKKQFLIVLSAILLLAPQFVRPRTYRGAERIGPARIFTGDEPHFLVQLHSFVSDFDLDIANNHALAEAGGPQTGDSFRGVLLDHHVDYNVNGHRVLWPDVFENGKKLRSTQSDASAVAELPERSSHGPYHAVITGLPLLLLKQVPDWMEPIAIFENALAIGVCALLTYQILGYFRASEWTRLFGSFCSVFATPLLHYSRALYGESFITAFVLAGVLFFLRKKYLGAGVFFALAAMLKPPIAVVCLPFVSTSLFRGFKPVIELAVPLGIGAFSVLLGNYFLYGAAFFFAQSFPAGNFLNGAYGLLFSLDHGLVTLAPIGIFAPVLWARFLKRYRHEGLLILSAASAYFVLLGMWPLWDGGTCYGPRLLLPVAPLLLLPVFLYLPGLIKVRKIRCFVELLFFISLAINILSVFPVSRFVGASPWTSKRFYIYTAIAYSLYRGYIRLQGQNSRYLNSPSTIRDA